MRNVYTVTRERAFEFLSNETGGRIISAYFRKRNGEIRRINFRRGVTQHLKGGLPTYDTAAKGHIPVFDMHKRAYRMVNTRTLISFNVGNETFVVH